MKFEIITLFPDFFSGFFKNSLMKRAIQSGRVDYHLLNLRKFGEGNYRRVDDYPYGGKQGNFLGMLLKEPVLMEAYRQTTQKYTIYLSPRGKVLTQNKVADLAKLDELVIICGHYEGVDQRFINHVVDEEISLGDYVLSGGESAAVVLMDAVSRQIPGFLGNAASGQRESFSGEHEWLESDQYTRPETAEVPPVLLSGNAKEIKKWSQRNALLNTYSRRPDLINKQDLTEIEEDWLKEMVFQSSVSR